MSLDIVPSEIGGAKVLHYIKIEKHHRPTGNTKQIVNGIVMGPAYGLAICKYNNQNGYYLFGCDENWQSITDTYHDSIEDAIEQGEFEYEDSNRGWTSK